MLIEAMLVIVTLLAALCVAMLYRMRSGSSVIAPILDQRLVAIEGSITRSDTLVRDESARGRDEARETARSLREEIQATLQRLGESIGTRIDDLTTAQGE